MPYTQLLYEKLDRIGRITLNRPRYRNAQSTVLLKELDRAFEEAALDDEVKVIILAGRGRAFFRRARPRHAGRKGKSE